MNEAEKEQRNYALAIYGGVCEVCGRPLRDGQPQGRHSNAKPEQALERKLIEAVHVLAGDLGIILQE